MSSKPPPVPPANRSPHGSASPQEQADVVEQGNRPVPGNLAEQDRQGNIKQNTTNDGYQQDR